MEEMILPADRKKECIQTVCDSNLSWDTITALIKLLDFGNVEEIETTDEALKVIARIKGEDPYEYFACYFNGKG